MIQGSTTNTMPVSAIAPAATKFASTSHGDGAFSEALAGAQTVNDQRDARTANSQGRDMKAQRASDQARPGTARGKDQSDRTDSTRHDDATVKGDAGDSKATTASRTDASKATANADGTEQADAGSAHDDAQAVTDTAAVDASADTTPDAVMTDAAATLAAGTAVTPVVTDLNAVLQPVVSTDVQVSTDAVDAAMRLTIADATVAAAPVATDVTDAAAAATDTPVTATTATTTATTAGASTAPAGATVTQAVATDEASALTVAAAATTAPDGATIQVGAPVQSTDATKTDDQPIAATIMQGAEDVDTGLAVGSNSPQPGVPAPTSGPTPALTTAVATDAPVDPSAPATTTAQVQAVAAAPVQAVAAGQDAPTVQLTQAITVEADASATTQVTDGSDATTTVDAADTQATTTVQASASAGAGDGTGAGDADTAEQAPVVVARPTTAPTGAQQQAAYAEAVQVKARTEAATEGGEQAVAVKAVDSSSVQASTTTLGAVNNDGLVNPAQRMREAQLAQGIGVQERIDHIAEQLATRLKLSHAAGGSEVNLSLKPRELGDVTVQMKVREGVVAATVLVENTDTLQTLQGNLDDLRKSLENQGLMVQEFSVGVRGDSGANASNTSQGRSGNSSSSAAAGIAGSANATPGLSGDREVTVEEVHDGNVSVLA